MMHVWICQCLCPQRHCILASAGEAEDAREAELTIASPLRSQVRELTDAHTIDPWCGLCKAERHTWQFETGRTRFQTMKEAEPALRESEWVQALAKYLI